MRKFLTGLLLILAMAGCRESMDESGGSGDDGQAGTGTGADTAPGRVVAETCVECAGLGRSPHSGDERPCFLGAGDGRCAICDGEGRSRDGLCPACDGTGKCLECGGDGVISGEAHDPGMEHAPVSGGCPVCIASSGFCPECGGTGLMPGKEVCRFCEGEGWCPECRGTGANRLCGGEGICPLCRGRGELEGDLPAAGYPPFTVHLKDGGRIVARILGPPSRMLSIERAQAGEVVRESIPLNDVKANDILLAFRLYTRTEGPGPLLSCARFAIRAGPEFLFAARRDARAARKAGASRTEVDLLLATVDDLFGKWLLTEARRKVEGDSRRALVLLQMHRRAFPENKDAEEVAGLLDQLSGSSPGDEGGLPAEVRERRAAALSGRILRLSRRADEWRVRAEDLLGTVGASEDALLRAHRAAFEAWLIFAGAANRAGEDLAPVLLRNAHQARALRIRALIALASRLLERGHLERARSLGVIALSLDPADAGAISFLAEVEGALGRRADEVKVR